MIFFLKSQQRFNVTETEDTAFTKLSVKVRLPLFGTIDLTMEDRDQDISSLEEIHVAKVSLGQWRLYLLEEPDLNIDGKPFVALTMMYHPGTHEYIWRALGRIVESGQVNSFQEFLGKCHQLFQSGSPCLGMKLPDADFPLSCQFSDHCSIMIPKTSGSSACLACLHSTQNPIRLGREIQDAMMDIIFNNSIKTLDALKHNVSPQKLWPCPLCSSHVKLDTIKSHLEKSHVLSHFACFHCDDRFVDARDLSLHTLQKHPEIQELFCPLCPENILINDDVDSLTNHFRACSKKKNIIVEQEKKGRKVFKCLRCFYPFRTKSMLEKHIEVCWTTKFLDKTVINEVKLKNDPLNVVPTTNVDQNEDQPEPSTTKCRMCTKEIGLKFVARHLMFHHCIGKFKCHICSKTFQTVQELTNHSTDNHPFHTSLSCPNCFKKVDVRNQRRSFIDHMNICHKIIFLPNMNGQRVPFAGTICSDCDHIFRNEADKEQHLSRGCNQERPTKRMKMGPNLVETTLELPPLGSFEKQLIDQDDFECALSSQKWTTLEDQLKDVAKAEENVDSNLQSETNVDEFLESSIEPKLEPVEMVLVDDMNPIKQEPLHQNEVLSKDNNPENQISLPKPKTKMILSRKHVSESRKRAQVSPSDAVECHICFRQLSSRILSRHKMFRHKLGRFTCSKCKSIFDTAEEVTEHVKTHPDVSKLPCPNCKQNVDLGVDQTGLENHIVTCHKLKFLWDETTQRYIQYIGRGCMDCGGIFRTIEQLAVHQENDICASGEGASERRKNYVQKLMRLKKENPELSPPIICDICGAKCVSVDKFKSHHRNWHLFEPVSCEICNKEFSNKTKLQHHNNRFHSVSDEFSCKDCKYRGCSPSDLKNHQLIHGPANYMCSFCGKRFKLPWNLKLHIRTHTREKPYE